MELPTPPVGRLLDWKQRFVRTMPYRIAVIASTLNDYRTGDRELTSRLEREFRTLAGTASAYDLRALAAAAFEGEEACVELNESPPASGDFTHLAFLVDQLRSALAIDAKSQS